MGIGGLPVFNVHNYCSTGSSALNLGYQAIASGMNECVLAFGFEKMQKGPLEKQLSGLEEIAKETDQGKAADRRAHVRRRRPPAHGEVRHHQGAVRQGEREEPPPLGEQPALAVPRGVHARGGARRRASSTTR